MKLVYLSKHFISLSIVLIMSSCAGTLKFYEGSELPNEQVCVLHVRGEGPGWRPMSCLFVSNIDGRKVPDASVGKILLLPGIHSVTAFVWYGSAGGGSRSIQDITFSCEAGHSYILYYETYGWQPGRVTGEHVGYWKLYIKEKN
jgi:hypothetical protein